MLDARFASLRDSPLALRITRYAVGSVLALGTSIVVFAALFALGGGTTLDSVLAFLAGAVPNWLLNRRWAWQRRGRVSIAREVIGYAAISLLALAAASAGTGWAHQLVRHTQPHSLRVALVTSAYVVVQGLLFAAKFLAYEWWVFAERAASRSRHQVWSTARANRSP